MNKNGLLCLLVGLFIPMISSAQRIALKTNALYWALATPNIELETRLAPKVTGALSVEGNFITVKDYKPSFFAINPEVRYWFERPMARHFLGLAGLFSDYDMKLKDKRHDGIAYGGGLTYGYAFVIGDRWNVELSMGVGAAYFREEKYNEGETAPGTPNHSRWTLVPLKTGVTFSYIIK